MKWKTLSFPSSSCWAEVCDDVFLSVASHVMSFSRMGLFLPSMHCVSHALQDLMSFHSSSFHLFFRESADFCLLSASP